jgi:hypothetical protein
VQHGSWGLGRASTRHQLKASSLPAARVGEGDTRSAQVSMVPPLTVEDTQSSGTSIVEGELSMNDSLRISQDEALSLDNVGGARGCSLAAVTLRKENYARQHAGERAEDETGRSYDEQLAVQPLHDL